ncbi:M23 family metallopeptidase [Flavobacteriaceae bacterium]|jgi:murein DD-endopeptidase MepM/ murein hydrolase activator NlpD|nr:M23 family metallopeptidase [Flavobacteriaceae bacterium]
MDKKENKKKKLYKRLISPYRMVIINEETFEERMQFRVSKLSLLLLSTFSLIFLAAMFFISIAYSPLKEFIPGYDSSELRKKAVQNLFITDSLITLYNQNIQYLNAVKAVLNEEVRFQDPEFSSDGLSTEDPEPPTFFSSIPEDSLLRAFVSQQDKYNPDSTNGEIPIETLLLPPAFGPISQEYLPQEEHYAVDIVLEENTPIKAISDGRVIFAEWTAETGYVIILDHNKGILSVYKHNAALSKSQGDIVQGGEVIALAGNTGEYTTGFHLHFELWIEGYPMNPMNFFNFSGE